MDVGPRANCALANSALDDYRPDDRVVDRLREIHVVSSVLLSTQLISVRDLNSVVIMNRLDLTGNDRTMDRLPIQGRKEQSYSSNRAQVQKNSATDQERDEKQSTAPSRFTLRVSTRSVFGGVCVFHGGD